MATTTHSSIPDISVARRRVPLVCIIVVWTLWGLWSAQQSLHLGRAVAPRAATFQLALATAWTWVLVTPAIMWLTRWARDRLGWRGSQIAVHVAAFALLHVVDAAAYSAASMLIAGAPRPFTSLLFSTLTFNTIVWTAIVAVTLAIDSRDTLRDRSIREAQLEAQLALAQFHALRAQLHPHFLFNTLNAISALMHTDVARADRMLARVGELLRIAIDTATAPEVRLVDEIDFVTRYLELERMRFGDRLDVRVHLADDTHDALVPNMLLQPLVENAVRYGVAPFMKAGRVEIRASRTGDRLSLVVSDSGSGVTNGDFADGVGLATTRARLEKLYGVHQHLTHVNVSGGLETRVVLPFRQRGEVLREDPLLRR